jgi:hypothetical protein
VRQGPIERRYASMACARDNTIGERSRQQEATMIERTLFTAFRDSYQRFCDHEIAPLPRGLGEQGFVDRSVWRKAGATASCA